MDLAAAFQRGLAHHRSGHLTAARQAYVDVLAVDPNHFDSLYALALVELQFGNPELAARQLARVIAIDSTVAPIHFNYGVALSQLKHYGESILSFDRAVVLKPDYIAAFLHRGRALGALGRASEAMADFDRVLVMNPNHAEAHNDRGKALGSLGMLEQAVIHFDQAITLKPDFAEACRNHAIALVALKRDEAAIESFRRALALKPDDAETHKNLAYALNRRSCREEALASFDHALALDPNCAVTHNSRGTILETLGRREEALISYQRAIACDPSYVEAYVNSGAMLINTQRYAEGLDVIDRAIALRPTFAPAHLNRAVAHDRLGRFEEAIDDYGKAIAYDPGIELIAGRRCYLLMLICRWDEIKTVQTSLLEQIDAGCLASAPFYILVTPSSPAQHRKVAELYSEKKASVTGNPPLPRKQRGAKIRVGYFSADFHFHAVTHLIAGLFEAHDRAGFEIIGFTFLGIIDDQMTRRLSAAFDQFIDVSTMTDQDVAGLARELKIDIAVDLTGHTSGGRPAIFAHRAAPIQVNYLGYPGTTGMDAMDYMIADPVLIPSEHRPYYSEKIATLPSYQVNDWKRAFPEQTISRVELGLPEKAFVFCGFNNAYKISPRVFDVWMRLLHKVEGSVLWLREGPEAAANNLRLEAERRGISADRLIVAKRIGMIGHLARHGAADLFLDTFTYNAHTTASDALWMGLPVITVIGETFPSRVTASLLTAVGLPELITGTVEQYEDLAFDLATHPDKLAKLKRHLQDVRKTCALFDTARFARNIEAAYRKMWEYENTGTAEHFHIKDIHAGDAS